MIDIDQQLIYKISQIFEGQLDPNIDIWMLDVHLISKTELLNTDKYLNSEEIQKSNKFLFERDKNSYLLRRIYLKIILSEYLRTHPQNIQIDYSRYQKPFVKNSPFNFNTSHSMTTSVIAVHKKLPIGIDIEEIKTIQNMPDLLQYFASSFEKKWINNSKKKFYLLWTIKESILKYKGTGLLNKKLPELKWCPTPLTNTLFYTKYQQLNIYSKLLGKKIISVCYGQ